MSSIGAAHIVKFRKPIYCKNASHLGDSKYMVSMGDLIFYRDTTEQPWIGRVLGEAKRLPDGTRPQQRMLLVLVLSSNMSHAYERYVPLDAITEIRTPTQSLFLSWFMGSEMPDFREVIGLVNYGACNNRYIDRLLDQDGNLSPNWRESSK